jgi:hypothetical protein
MSIFSASKILKNLISFSFLFILYTIAFNKKFIYLSPVYFETCFPDNPWSRVYAEKLVAVQQVKQFPAFYGRNTENNYSAHMSPPLDLSRVR